MAMRTETFSLAGSFAFSSIWPLQSVNRPRTFEKTMCFTLNPRLEWVVSMFQWFVFMAPI